MLHAYSHVCMIKQTTDVLICLCVCICVGAREYVHECECSFMSIRTRISCVCVCVCVLYDYVQCCKNTVDVALRYIIRLIIIMIITCDALQHLVDQLLHGNTTQNMDVWVYTTR